MSENTRTDSNTEVLIAIGRLEERFLHLGKKIDEFSKVSETVIEAKQSASSAHKRLDSMETEVEKLPTRVEHNNHDERIRSLESNRAWVITVIIGAVLMALLGLVIVQI